MAVKPPDNLCPFGCQQPDLDENGVCAHVLGFTNDCKTYEPLVRGKRGYRHVDANRFDRESGLYTPNRIEIDQAQVESGEIKLVNPETEQLVDGVIHLVKKFVSARVYKKNIKKTGVPALASKG